MYCSSTNKDARRIVLIRKIGLALKEAFTWIGVVMFGLIGILVSVALSGRMKRRHDAEASAAEDEARKVKEAGGRGNAEEVLDSFRRSTNKWL